MHRIEFKETLKAFKIANPILDIKGNLGIDEEVHIWQNIALYYSGSSYVVIKGKIPLEVAQIIYEKYPNNSYGIHINGEEKSSNPRFYAIDEKFAREIAEIEQTINPITNNPHSKELLVKIKKAQAKLQERNDNKKYIKTYHIDSLEGLVIFIAELKDYYARQLGYQETEVQNISKSIALITNELLKKVYITTCPQDWVKYYTLYYETYIKAIANSSKSKNNPNFRLALEKFVQTINPFINLEIELDSIEKYIEKVRIGAKIYNQYQINQGAYLYETKLQDRASHNSVSIAYKNNGFSYGLEYSDELKDLILLYQFEFNSQNKEDAEESIIISFKDKKTNTCIKLKYNLTKGLIIKMGEKTRKATMEEKLFIYELLNQTIALASTITINNLARQSQVKKLTL